MLEELLFDEYWFSLFFVCFVVGVKSWEESFLYLEMEFYLFIFILL